MQIAGVLGIAPQSVNSRVVEAVCFSVVEPHAVGIYVFHIPVEQNQGIPASMILATSPSDFSQGTTIWRLETAVREYGRQPYIIGVWLLL